MDHPRWPHGDTPCAPLDAGVVMVGVPRTLRAPGCLPNTQALAPRARGAAVGIAAARRTLVCLVVGRQLVGGPFGGGRYLPRGSYWAVHGRDILAMACLYLGFFMYAVFPSRWWWPAYRRQPRRGRSPPGILIAPAGQRPRAPPANDGSIASSRPSRPWGRPIAGSDGSHQ